MAPTFTYHFCSAEKKEIRISGVYPAEPSLVIPARIDGYPVSVIEKKAFSGSEIREVYIEDGITVIEDEAFKSCRKLTAIRLPETLAEVGNHVFENCICLTEISLPASIRKMGNAAFIHCLSLSRVTLADGIQSLGESTFLECCSLEEIKLPDSIRTISFSMFWHCRRLKRVTAGAQTELIGRDAFRGCESLTALSVPSCIRSVGKNAFGGTPLELPDPDGICMINGKIFYSCMGNQKQLQIPDGTTVIAEDACSGNEVLKSIHCPDTLRGIGRQAFKDCRRLEQVRLNPGLSSMEAGAFEGCRKLKDIRLPDTLTILGEKAFLGCVLLERIVIPPRITRIPDYAFKDCESALQIYFAGKVTEIGASAFEYCRSVTHLKLPHTASQLGKCAFYGCSSLSDVSFPETIRVIEEDAFGQCPALTNIRTRKWLPGQGFLGLGNSTDITFLKEDGSVWLTLFYADDWRRFADIPARDRLVHAFLRAPGFIDFESYDTCLDLLKYAEDQIDLALNRLMTPVELSDAARKQYETFLCLHPYKTIDFILKKNLPDAVLLLFDIHFFTEEIITKAIQMAGLADNTPILLLLMEYKNYRFGTAMPDDLFRIDL